MIPGNVVVGAPSHPCRQTIPQIRLRPAPHGRGGPVGSLDVESQLGVLINASRLDKVGFRAPDVTGAVVSAVPLPVATDEDWSDQ